MREKQIEELAQVIAHSCIDLVESSCGEGECCVSCLATKLHKEGVTVQKWIPVTERLPECEGSYIVYTERGSVYASHFYTEKRFASGYVREKQWSQRGTVKVTHWMPLPEPPKGE